MSTKRWYLIDMCLVNVGFNATLLNQTKTQCLSNVETWWQPSVGVWHDMSFDYQQEFNVYTMVGLDDNSILISNQNSTSV